MQFDILVVGGGMAGAVAALKAAEKGTQVAVVRKGYGATALSSGAIELAADPLRIPGRPWEDERDWRLNAREIVRRDPFHPYSLLASSGFPPDSHLAESLAFLIRELEAVGLSLFPDPVQNLLLTHPVAGVLCTGTAQESQGRGDLHRLRGRNIVVVGIEHLDGFPAGHLAQTLREFLEPEGYGPIECQDITLPGFTGGTAWEASLAIEEKIDTFRELCREVTGEGHVIFPPVLGLARHREVNEAVRNSGLKDFSEALAVPTSVPGFRLQAALDRALENRGVRVLNGCVRGGEVLRRRVRSLLAEVDGKEVGIEIGAVVLATGKYIGGGIVRGREFREPVFDLPVFLQGRWLEDDFIRDLLAREPLGPHPAFRAGVKVDGNLCPCSREDEPVAENLFAAGALLSGVDSAAGGSGLGAALLTGFRAGMEAGRIL